MWILREVQQRGGEVDFRQFMELALYHPEHGYYCSAATPWGRDRDFLTAPTASGWYPATWAGFLGELAGRAGTRCSLADVAAGDGSFVAAVLDALGVEAPAVLASTSLIDRSATMRARARARLAAAPVGVEINAVLPARLDRPAVVHASELYDAMPVHRVEQTATELSEMVVAVEDGALVWRRRPAGPELVRYFAEHGVALADGQIAEVNPAAESSHREVLESAGEGLVAVLDYGYEASRLYDPRGRRHGSLVSTRRHRVGRDLLDSPGEQDLTAHVNWDDLRRAAAACGWDEIGLIPLAEFLVRAGLGRRLDDAGFGIEADLDADTVTARQEVKRLLDPEGMGADLKVLIQGRGTLGEIAAELLSRPV
jgi:SAM-dependent MidA family methyltransferase